MSQFLSRKRCRDTCPRIAWRRGWVASQDGLGRNQCSPSSRPECQLRSLSVQPEPEPVGGGNLEVGSQGGDEAPPVCRGDPFLLSPQLQKQGLLSGGKTGRQGNHVVKSHGLNCSPLRVTNCPYFHILFLKPSNPQIC